MEIILRDYQLNAIDSVRNSYIKGKTAPLLVMPTGAGKTICFCKIAQSATNINKRILILVHRSELLNQASEKLTQFGIVHGRVSPQFKPEYHIPVQVASVDTIIKRLEFIEKPDLIILDEAHHLIKGNKWGRVVEQFPEAKLLGVTATPTRLNGAGLGLHAEGFFDDLILGASVENLMNQGFLVNALYYAPPSLLNEKNIKIVRGDYCQQELATATNRGEITGEAIKNYLKLSNNLPAIAFCVDIHHAQCVAKSFTNAGIPSDFIDGTLNPSERKSRIDKLSSGEIKVLTSVNVISEGTDIPVATTAIILRKTKSLGMHLQMIGRILRPAKDKKNALVIDHVGNILSLGFAETLQNWTLNGENKVQNISSIAQCSICFRVFNKLMNSYCPECSKNSFIKEEIKKLTGNTSSQGEYLVQISPKDPTFNAQKSTAKEQEIRSAKTIEELRVIARKYGYKPGWVYHMTKYLPQHRSFNL